MNAPLFAVSVVWSALFIALLGDKIHGVGTLPWWFFVLRSLAESILVSLFCLFFGSRLRRRGSPLSGTLLEGVLIFFPNIYALTYFVYRISGLGLLESLSVLLDVDNSLVDVSFTQARVTLAEMIKVLAPLVGYISVATGALFGGRRFALKGGGLVTAVCVALVAADALGGVKVREIHAWRAEHRVQLVGGWWQSAPAAPTLTGVLQGPPPCQEISVSGPRVQPQKSSILLVVIESLRWDLLSPTHTPHLWKFSTESLRPAMALANSNGTAQAWHAIFNAEIPLYWGVRRHDPACQGALGLRIFKNAGYSLALFASSPIKSFFNSYSLVFGAQGALLDTSWSAASGESPDVSDARMVQELANSLSRQPGVDPAVRMVFFESTHYPYYAPENETVAIPSLFGWSPSISPTDAALLRKRYLGALAHVDRLFGSMMDDLKRAGLLEKTIVAVAGDHGEELGESGFIGHMSALRSSTLQIPIWIRIPGVPAATLDFPASQIDIVPTLLDGAGLFSESASRSFSGESWLRSPSPHRVIASNRFNGTFSPRDFMTWDGEHAVNWHLISGGLAQASTLIRLDSGGLRLGSEAAFGFKVQSDH